MVVVAVDTTDKSAPLEQTVVKVRMWFSSAAREAAGVVDGLG